MADSRGKDLTGTVISSELQALLSSLYFNVDASSFSEAKKIVLQTLLTEAVIAANSNNYQAMTPKAFYDSIMTTARKGIGQLSTDANVIAKSGTGLLNAVHQTLMQTQWLKDWFEVNGIPNQIKADSFTAPKAMKFDVCFYNTIAATTGVAISPTLPTNTRFKNIYFTWVVGIDTLSSTNLPLRNGTGALDHTGSVTSYILASLIGGSDLDLRLSADGREISVYAPGSLGSFGVSLCISINAIVEAYT